MFNFKSYIILFLCVVASATTQGQTYFSQFAKCDSCLAATYGSVLINHNQDIIALGGEANWNTFSIFLDHYDANTATYNRHVYHDSLKNGVSSFFQNLNNNYYIISQILINDTVGFNGTCINQLHKIDTNFNLYEKKLINIKRYDSADYYLKSIFINNQIYLFGSFLDSANGYWIKSAGLSVIDTNGNLIKRKVFHTFPNNNTVVSDAFHYNSNFYIAGYFQTNPDICTNYLEGFIIKIDTIGNYITHRSFLRPYENFIYGGTFLSNNTILITGGFSPTCNVMTKHWHQQNMILDTFLNILADTSYSTVDEYNAGKFALNRNSNSAMILAIKQPSTIKGKGFEFQVCNNDGQLLTEALHNVPNDSSIIEEKGNTVNHVIRNTNTNGYILVGSGSRLSNNGLWNASSQPWILSVDSNGCVDPNCAVAVGISREELVQNDITIFPNPSHNKLFFINSFTLKNYTWQVLSPLGYEIQTGTKNIIDLQNFTDGIYYLKIMFKNQSFTYKLIAL